MAKLDVIRDLCIGCGACIAIDANLFGMDDEGVAIVNVATVEEASMESATDAVNGCPTSAITLTEN